MKERPMLFSGPMVRAILDGRKTMTRRVVDLDYAQYDTDGVLGYEDAYGDHHNTIDLYKYGRPGDRLWVRETWATPASYDQMKPSDLGRTCPIYYHADKSHGQWTRWEDEDQERGKLRPSIFLPRWASRITLELTAVRIDRVRAITWQDCIAEGATHEAAIKDPCDNFRDLWDSINGKRPGCAWADKPWVWVISFRRVAQ
jgi:hypothetical protein